MVYTTCAFYQNIDASAALTEVDAVSDTHLTVSGKDITIPDLNLVLGGMVLGQGITEAQIASPSLRSMALYDIADFLPLPNLPGNQDIDEGGSAAYTIPQGAGLFDIHSYPVELVPSEKLNFRVKNAGAAPTYGIFFLSDSIPAPVTGKMGLWSLSRIFPPVAMQLSVCGPSASPLSRRG